MSFNCLPRIKNKLCECHSKKKSLKKITEISRLRQLSTIDQLRVRSAEYHDKDGQFWVLMSSLYLASALATETGTLGDNQRGESRDVGEQSCPTWYRETKHNGVTKCVCGAIFDGEVVCDYETEETRMLAGYCMTYDGRINDTVIGRCPFSYHYPDTQIFYITLPNDISELNSFMCSGLNRTGLLCSHCQQSLGPAVLSYMHEALCKML